MEEALHTVLGSLHHTGGVELLMVTLCLAHNAISSLCTSPPPEMPLPMATFLWKHISSQPHQFGFFSSITSTLLFGRTTKPKNSYHRPFCFLTVSCYEYSSCNHKYLLTRSVVLSSCYQLPALSSTLQKHRCMRGPTACVGGTGKLPALLSYYQTKVITDILYVCFSPDNCFAFTGSNQLLL